MNTNGPEFKAAVARLYARLQAGIQDEALSDPDDQEKQSRFRRTVIVVSEKTILADQKRGFSVWDLYHEGLQMISVDLKEGYQVPVVSVEAFDHQGREWVLGKLEQLFNDEHPWRAMLKENKELVALFAFGYGSIKGAPPPGSTEVEYGLLPTAFAQLVDFTTEDGKMLALEDWTLQRDGVFIEPESLKRFGRPEPD